MLFVKFAVEITKPIPKPLWQLKKHIKKKQYASHAQRDEPPAVLANIEHNRVHRKQRSYAENAKRVQYQNNP